MFSISIRSTIIVLLFPHESFENPGRKVNPGEFQRMWQACIDLYIATRDRYEFIILVTRAHHDGLNGMYKIHIVQFLALSLPFFLRARSKTQEKEKHAH